MERDWFLERLQLIAHDILTVGEREEKEKRRWTNIGPQGLSARSENEVTASLHLEEVLTQGIQVILLLHVEYHLYNVYQTEFKESQTKEMLKLLYTSYLR